MRIYRLNVNQKTEKWFLRLADAKRQRQALILAAGKRAKGFSIDACVVHGDPQQIVVMALNRQPAKVTTLSCCVQPLNQAERKAPFVAKLQWNAKSAEETKMVERQMKDHLKQGRVLYALNDNGTPKGKALTKLTKGMTALVVFPRPTRYDMILEA